MAKAKIYLKGMEEECKEVADRKINCDQKQQVQGKTKSHMQSSKSW